MRKVNHAAKHEIAPTFSEFVGIGFSSMVLKEEYRCKKCGETVKIAKYEEEKVAHYFLMMFVIASAVVAADRYRVEVGNYIAEILLNFYDFHDFLLKVLICVIRFILLYLPFAFAGAYVIWLERRHFLRKYCRKLSEQGISICTAERSEIYDEHPVTDRCIGLKVLIGVYLSVAIPLVLIKLESVLNPQHIPAYQVSMRIGYVVSGMFFGLSIIFKFMMVGKSRERGDEEAIKKNRLMTTVISTVLFVVMLTCFVVSARQ